MRGFMLTAAAGLALMVGVAVLSPEKSNGYPGGKFVVTEHHDRTAELEARVAYLEGLEKDVQALKDDLAAQASSVTKHSQQIEGFKSSYPKPVDHSADIAKLFDSVNLLQAVTKQQAKDCACADGHCPCGDGCKCSMKNDEGENPRPVAQEQEKGYVLPKSPAASRSDGVITSLEWEEYQHCNGDSCEKRYRQVQRFWHFSPSLKKWRVYRNGKWSVTDESPSHE